MAENHRLREKLQRIRDACFDDNEDCDQKVSTPTPQKDDPS